MSLAGITAGATFAGLIVASPAVAVTPPGAPTALVSFSALHGVGLTWKGDYSGTAPTTYTIYSRPNSGSSWTQIGTENAGTTNHNGSYIDGTIAKGASADYAVTESNANGESAKTSPLTASRPAADPIAGSDDALAVDVGSDPTLSNEAFDGSSGATMSLANNVLTGAASGQTASATIPANVAPGSYSVGTPAVPLGLTTNGATCSSLSGTLSVIDVAYNLNLDPVLFSASYAVSCDGGPTVYGDLRWNSTQPYRGIVVSPTSISDFGAPVGSGAETSVVITNFGTETSHVGSTTITGPQASDWSVQNSNCSNLTYSAGGSCVAYLSFSPSDSGHRNATLTIADSSARGSHTVALDGIGELAPSPPPTTARLAVHQVQISWTAPNDGGAPILEYYVYKTAPGQGQQLVATVTPEVPDVGGTYSEKNVPTGIDYQYSVIALNAAGASADAVVNAMVPSDEILIDGSTAITTSGDEPLTVATPDIHGRVAVVPGSDRIVYPAKYSTGAIDLAVASPYGSVGQSRLTTIGATDPAVSADGLNVAFVHVSVTGEPSIWTVPLAGGNPKKIAADFTNPSWLADGKTLVAEPSTQEGTPATSEQLVALSPNGSTVNIAGTLNGHEPSVSPDGTHIAFQLYDAGTYSLAVVPAAGGTASTSSATASGPISAISWRSDGERLFAAEGGKVKQATYSTGAGPGTLTTLSPPDVTGVRWPAYINSEAVRLLDPTPVTGKRPTLAISTASDATSTCSLDGGTPITCDKAWNSPIDLSAGRHTLIVTSTPTSAVASSAIWSFIVDGKKPTISLHHLPKTTHQKRLAIHYSGKDDVGVASYDVRYVKGPSKRKLGNYHYPPRWQETTAKSVSLRVHRGRLYCISARDHDRAGNVSKWSKERCVTAR